MNLPSTLIGIAQVGFIVALIPTLLSLLGIKTINIGLTITGVVYGLFLVMAAIGILGLGATLGGVATLGGAVMWFIIAFFAARRSKGEK